MSISAPTPLPLACSRANSGSRSSIFSKLIDMRSAAEPERHLHLRAPVAVVRDVEALDAGHQLGHLRRVVEDAPRRRSRGAANDLVPSTFIDATPPTRARASRPGRCSSSQTRWYGLRAVVDDRPAGRPQRVLQRGADGVDAGAAALAHALRAERRERRRRLDVAGLIGGMSSACGTW